MRKLLLVFVLLLSACRSNGFYQPYTTDLKLPDGPPEYKAGWRAGCRTGLSAGSPFFTNSFVYPSADYGDGAYHNSPLFVAGWLDSTFVCFESQSTWGGVKDLFEGPLE